MSHECYKAKAMAFLVENPTFKPYFDDRTTSSTQRLVRVCRWSAMENSMSATIYHLVGYSILLWRLICWHNIHFHVFPTSSVVAPIVILGANRLKSSSSSVYRSIEGLSEACGASVSTLNPLSSSRHVAYFACFA